ncbi:hypothetical protein [Microbulbifer sp. JMSA008]|uniref:hypothetical protein n=1 Tax=unclassified Microbulbifer TaxID=2619833 RepID=UPI00403B2190
MSKVKVEWKVILLSAFAGAFLTGISQYLLLNASYDNDIKKAKLLVRQELLMKELEERKKAYKGIRKAVLEFHNARSERDMLVAGVKINALKPYFERVYRSQASVEAWREKMMEKIKNKDKEASDDFFEEMEAAFHADLKRIESQILE